MSTEAPVGDHPESRLRTPEGDGSLLLQIRSDRRLGHEWDDWDGKPLPDAGDFTTGGALFYGLTGLLIGGTAFVGLAVVWLAGPRLTAIWEPADRLLAAAVIVLAIVAALWLLIVAVSLWLGRNLLPPRLAERGLVPWLMPRLEWLAVALGMSRDRTGNAMLRVYNRLTVARRRSGVSPDEILILLPRCLGKEAMRQAMDVSERYGVPMFVAARGRYARQMISMRRPKRIVAVACERDLVSGVHHVAGRLPVLGTTLRLADGPCRNTEIDVVGLEAQVRTMLGLGVDGVGKRGAAG